MPQTLPELFKILCTRKLAKTLFERGFNTVPGGHVHVESGARGQVHTRSRCGRLALPATAPAEPQHQCSSAHETTHAPSPQRAHCHGYHPSHREQGGRRGRKGVEPRQAPNRHRVERGAGGRSCRGDPCVGIPTGSGVASLRGRNCTNGAQAFNPAVDSPCVVV